MTDPIREAMEAAKDATFDSMDIADGLDVIAAETYSRAAVLAFLKRIEPTEGMIAEYAREITAAQSGCREFLPWTHGFTAMLSALIKEIEGMEEG